MARPDDALHAAIWDHGRAYGEVAALDGHQPWQDAPEPPALLSELAPEDKEVWRDGFRAGVWREPVQ